MYSRVSQNILRFSDYPSRNHIVQTSKTAFLHVLTCVNMCPHVLTCANMCSHVFTCTFEHFPDLNRSKKTVSQSCPLDPPKVPRVQCRELLMPLMRLLSFSILQTCSQFFELVNTYIIAYQYLVLQVMMRWNYHIQMKVYH